jgi:hypothetical protein
MFHLSLEAGSLAQPWASHPHEFYGSGRDALRALVAFGIAKRWWRRLLVPSYYCREVLDPLQGIVPIEAYPHSPTRPAASIHAEPDDLVLVASLFGSSSGPAVAAGATVVEDHTHDPVAPWSWQSGAQYAFASLRKTLPLPDGGVVWSPQDRGIPPSVPVTPEHARATQDRLTAMVLKFHYLAGHDVAKADYRGLALDSEQAIGEGGISGMSAYSRARLPTFPGEAWRARRARNLQAFRDALGDVSGLRFLDVPFAATVVFDALDQRDRIRERLVHSSIYATVYWPMTSTPTAGLRDSDAELSARILSIHCDHRYTVDDMTRVARALHEAVRAS